MANILIFGAGAIGSAFSVPCLDRQHQVRIVGTYLEENFIDELKNKKHFHPTLKCHLSKNTSIVKYSDLPNELKNSPDLIVLAVSSKGINWIVDQLNYLSHGKNLPPILMLTKGLNLHENIYEDTTSYKRRITF